MKGVAAAYKARNLHDFERVREEYKDGMFLCMRSLLCLRVCQTSLTPSPAAFSSSHITPHPHRHGGLVEVGTALRRLGTAGSGHIFLFVVACK